MWQCILRGVHELRHLPYRESSRGVFLFITYQRLRLSCHCYHKYLFSFAQVLSNPLKFTLQSLNFVGRHRYNNVCIMSDNKIIQPLEHL